MSVSHVYLIVTLAVAGAGGMMGLGAGMTGSLLAPCTATGSPKNANTSAVPVLGATSQAGVGRALRALFARSETFVAQTDARALSTASKRWDVPRYAFGDTDNPLEFSFELEGTTTRGVVNYYRPSDVSETSWQAKTSSERAQFVHERGSHPWKNWVRLSTAPTWMTKKLKWEAGGSVWEITSDTHARSLDEMWRQAEELRRTAGEHGFHFHVTFLPSTRFANEVAAQLAFVDEAFTTRMYDFAPRARRSRTRKARRRRYAEQSHDLRFSNVGHRYLRPFRQEQLDKVRSGLQKSDSSADTVLTQLNQKLHSVGFRSELYDEPNRVGIEFRATSSDALDMRAWLERTVEFLEDPSHAHAEPLAWDRLSRHTVDRIGGEAFTKKLDHFASVGHSSLAAGIYYDAAHWGYPMLRWEQRPNLAHAGKRIMRARARYVRRVNKIAKRFDRAADEKRYSRHWADAMNYAVERFVHDSGIAVAYQSGG